MTAAHVGGHGEVSLALSYPVLFRVTGPLPSLVLRAEDMWWRHNQFHRSEWALNLGFPSSPFGLWTLIAPFQGFARRCEIQVFRLYSTPSPVTKSQCRFVVVRVSPSYPYNAGRARTRMGGGVYINSGFWRNRSFPFQIYK